MFLHVESVPSASSNMSEAVLHGVRSTRILPNELSLPRDSRVALQGCERWDC